MTQRTKLFAETSMYPSLIRNSITILIICHCRNSSNTQKIVSPSITGCSSLHHLAHFIMHVSWLLLRFLFYLKILTFFNETTHLAPNICQFIYTSIIHHSFNPQFVATLKSPIVAKFPCMFLGCYYTFYFFPKIQGTKTFMEHTILPPSISPDI